MEGLSEKIVEHIEGNGLTKAEFAKELGVAPSTLRRLLSGETRALRLRRAIRLTEVLGITFEELRVLCGIA